MFWLGLNDIVSEGRYVWISSLNTVNNCNFFLERKVFWLKIDGVTCHYDQKKNILGLPEMQLMQELYVKTNQPNLIPLSPFFHPFQKEDPRHLQLSQNNFELFLFVQSLFKQFLYLKFINWFTKLSKSEFFDEIVKLNFRSRTPTGRKTNPTTDLEATRIVS
jgi:hypothetical protein